MSRVLHFSLLSLLFACAPEEEEGGVWALPNVDLPDDVQAQEPADEAPEALPEDPSAAPHYDPTKLPACDVALSGEVAGMWAWRATACGDAWVGAVSDEADVAFQLNVGLVRDEVSPGEAITVDFAQKRGRVAMALMQQGYDLEAPCEAHNGRSAVPEVDQSWYAVAGSATIAVQRWADSSQKDYYADVILDDIIMRSKSGFTLCKLDPQQWDDMRLGWYLPY